MSKIYLGLCLFHFFRHSTGRHKFRSVRERPNRYPLFTDSSSCTDDNNSESAREAAAAAANNAAAMAAEDEIIVTAEKLVITDQGYHQLQDYHNGSNPGNVQQHHVQAQGGDQDANHSDVAKNKEQKKKNNFWSFFKTKKM